MAGPSTSPTGAEHPETMSLADLLAAIALREADLRGAEMAVDELHRRWGRRILGIARMTAAMSLATEAVAASDRTPTDAAQCALREQAEAQVATLREHLAAAERAAPTRTVARRALRAFEPVWAELAPRERQDLLRQLVSAIAIDGDQGSAAFTFRSEGIAAMANRPGAA